MSVTWQPTLNRGARGFTISWALRRLHARLPVGPPRLIRWSMRTIQLSRHNDGLAIRTIGTILVACLIRSCSALTRCRFHATSIFRIRCSDARNCHRGRLAGQRHGAALGRRPGQPLPSRYPSRTTNATSLNTGAISIESVGTFAPQRRRDPERLHKVRRHAVQMERIPSASITAGHVRTIPVSQPGLVASSRARHRATATKSRAPSQQSRSDMPRSSRPQRTPFAVRRPRNDEANSYWRQH
jgi:hypothetical protein